MGNADQEWDGDEPRRRDAWAAPLNEDSPGTPKRLGSALRLWVCAALLAAAIFGSPAAHRWWEASQRPEIGATAPRQLAPAGPARTTETAQSLESAPAEEVSESAGETRVVAKCVERGRVSYTASGHCQSGSTVGVPIASGPAPEEVHAAQRRAEQLSEQAAEIDRQAAWRDWHLEQEIVARSRPANLAKTSECDGIEQQIKALDAQARQPQMAAMQDWLKDQRAQARSRQFALHC